MVWLGSKFHVTAIIFPPVIAMYRVLPHLKHKTTLLFRMAATSLNFCSIVELEVRVLGCAWSPPRQIYQTDAPNDNLSHIFLALAQFFFPIQMSSWNEFRSKMAGKGLSMKELSDMYKGKGGARRSRSKSPKRKSPKKKPAKAERRSRSKSPKRKSPKRKSRSKSPVKRRPRGTVPHSEYKAGGPCPTGKRRTTFCTAKHRKNAPKCKDGSGRSQISFCRS
jgi:hypothetical protein